MNPRNERFVVAAVALSASLIAILSACPFAGGYNDGSRLATVESLVDQGTLAIDHSVFVQTPPATAPAHQLPYPAIFPWLFEHGTFDKALVKGKYYSDKPPVQAVLMAGVYWGLKKTCSLDARERTDRFCYLMTLTSSGLAYVLAVVFAYRMGRTLGLTWGWSLLLCATLGLATIALPYARHVNGHILLLAVAMILFERLLAIRANRATAGAGTFLLIGTLVGLGYALEQPTGLLMLVGTLGVLFLRQGSFRGPILALLGALPWMVLHHGIIYAISGNYVPLGAVPEYFDYPDSPFNATNLTGLWLHANLGEFALYAGGLLFGPQGFLVNNLPVLLAVVAAPFLWRRLPDLRVEILFAAGWCVGTWLIYAALSNNYSGVCCSVRWFLPLLAPGCFLLALLLREYPRWRFDFLFLAVWGTVLGVVMWRNGPWDSGLFSYWKIIVWAVATWLVTLLPWRFRRERRWPFVRPAAA